MLTGDTLGPYRVLDKLGEGGMGAVYRARDTKLNRDVALKVLPDAFANDAERLARFTREAQTLASLNHPHIAAIYGLEESGGVRALVMELVEGEDLSTLIARGCVGDATWPQAQRLSPNAHGLPVDEALAIARQIAEALEAAHEQGIIHRDLKPANIKVRDDGVVKVLDFGLAKAIDTAGQASQAGGARRPGGIAGAYRPDPPDFPDLSASPTLTSPAMLTGAGMILGTAAYMAPEQAKGRAVDKRADIWAFGCVLFEMLTGTRAFPGENLTDTLANVLKTEPAWIRDLYRKPADGSGSEELLLQSADIKRANAWSPDGRFILYTSSQNNGDLMVLPMSGNQQPEERKPFAFLSTPFNEQQGVFSPDGKWVAYHSNESGRNKIYVRPFPGPGGQWQTSTGGGTSPRWRADGKELYYLAPDNKLMAAAAGATGGTFVPGTPEALFQTHPAAGVFRPTYDVARDGRFLVNTELQDASAEPIHLLLNWKPPSK